METAKWVRNLDVSTLVPTKTAREFPAPSAKQALVTVPFAAALLRRMRRKSSYLIGTVAIV